MAKLTTFIHGLQAGSLLMCLTLLCGCSEYNAAQHRVDPLLAKQTLEQTLQAWIDGESIDSLRQRPAEIVVQDRDWETGLRLISFEVLGEGTPIDANLQCDVRLHVEDTNGKSQEKKVTYLVSTSPALTVFRQFHM